MRKGLAGLLAVTMLAVGLTGCRETTVARLLAEGRTVAQIARETGLATNTVRYHRDRIRVTTVAAPSEPVATSTQGRAGVGWPSSRLP